MSNINPGLTLKKALKLKAQIATLQAELSEQTAALADLVDNQTGQHIVPGVGSFTVSENNTYPTDVIKAQLSPGQVKRVSVLKVDNAVVKRLYPEAYAAAKQTNGVKVSVK